MTKKLEVTVAIVQDLIAVCVAQNRFDLVGTLAKLLITPAPVAESATSKKSAAKKSIAKKKRTRKSTKPVLIDENAPGLETAEAARVKRREYMRERRAKLKGDNLE